MGCCLSVLLTSHRFAENERWNECSKRISLCNHVTYVIVIRMLRGVCLFVNSIGRMESSDSPSQNETDWRQTTIEFFHSVGREKKGKFAKHSVSSNWKCSVDFCLISNAHALAHILRIIRIFASIACSFSNEFIITIAMFLSLQVGCTCHYQMLLSCMPLVILLMQLCAVPSHTQHTVTNNKYTKWNVL